jgi:hypothetical protein
VQAAARSPAVGACIAFVAYLAVLPLAAYFVERNRPDFWISVVIIALGGAVGWSLGVAASPYNTDKGKRFARIIGALAIFGSGYLAAKTDKLVEMLLSLATFRAMGEISAFRLAEFLTMAITAMLYTYSKRSYTDRRPEGDSGS